MGRDDVDMDPETSVRDRTGQDRTASSSNVSPVQTLCWSMSVPLLAGFFSAVLMSRHGSVYLLAGFSLLVKFQLWMCVFTGLALFCVLTVSPWLSVFTGWVNVPLWIHIINVWNLSCSFSSMSHLSACFYLLVVVVVIINVILPLVKVRCPTMAQCI